MDETRFSEGVDEVESRSTSATDPAAREDTMPLAPEESSGVEYLASHHARVGALDVRRAIPQRRRRSIGAWCFADHMGPADVTEGSGLDVGPHPHTGLKTVTWLIDGQALHRDSLGSEQVIRAGELNLMSAGRGVSHAEEPTGHYRGTLQGIQLWIAQDDQDREGAPDFEHHTDLSRVELTDAAGTVLIGDFAGVRAHANYGQLVGLELRVHGRTTLPLEADYEYGLIVLEGLVELGGRDLGPGTLGYVAPGRHELRVSASRPSTLIVLGGRPLEQPVFMWWNFVARSRREIDEAYDSWRRDDGRFGHVASALARVETSPPYWRSSRDA